MKRYPVVLLVLTLLLPGLPVAAAWVQETVDQQEGRMFAYPQIVIDDLDTTHVLYHDGTGWGIRYARNSGSGWQSEIVDDVGYLMPVYALAFDDGGEPLIGFRGATSHLEFAIRETGGWASAKIDSSGGIDRISAATDATGEPIFAYVRDDVIRLAHRVDQTWESLVVAPIPDCGYLRLRMNTQDEPVIGALDENSGEMRVYTGTADLSSWSVDDALAPARADYGVGFDLDADGVPHWCYCDEDHETLVIASKDGGTWTDITLTPPTIPLYQKILTIYDFAFDREGHPGLVSSNHYAHFEDGDWVWRETATVFSTLSASLGFHAGGNATIITGPLAFTWWAGQPVLALDETGHVWDDAYDPWDLVIRNTGEMPLVIDEIDYISGDSAIFPVLGTTFPLTIQPDASGVITFDFQPEADGAYTAEIELETNDPAAPSPTITLEGEYESAEPGGIKPILVTNVHADMLNKRLVEDIPLIGAEVSLLQGAATAYGPLASDGNGTVSFTGVTPGAYSIMAMSTYPDPEDPEVTRQVRSYIRSINIHEGLNPQATVVLPDSLMQQAYRATYLIEDMGGSDLMEFAYPAAPAARQTLADLGQDMSSYERIQSVSRLMLACDVTGMMFYDAALVGDSFVAGIGNLCTFLFYSNNWLDSIIDIIKIFAKSITDKLGAILDSIMLVAKVVLRFVVQAAVDYALGFLPCDETDLVCVRDLGKAAWNGMNEAFGGFGINAFSYDEWDYFVEKAEELLIPVFFQLAYIDDMTDPDLEAAVERSANLDYASTFDYVAPRTYEDLEENAEITDNVAEICNDLLTAAQLMYATAMVLDALENLPYLGILGTVGDIMNVSAWLSLGSSLGTSGGIYFTQPLFLDGLIDDIYDPFDKSQSAPPPCATAGRPLTTEARTRLESALKTATNDYDAVIADIRSSVQANDAESAALALADLAEADRRWMRQSELARKPIHAVAAGAGAVHTEFAAQYDTLLARNTAAGAGHLKTYLGVLALSADEKGDIKDYILQQLDETVEANTAFSDHMVTILETVSDLPVPAIIAAARIGQSADRLQAGRIDTLTVRLQNLGGVAASDIDLVLSTSENLEVVDTDSLRIASLAADAESAEYLFFVQPAGPDTTDALWSLAIRSPDAEQAFETGLFLAPIGGVTPETGDSLKSENVYNYPNPFRPETGSTTIRFSLAKAARVDIRIYDNGNRLVRNLLRDSAYDASEEIAVSWDGRNGRNEIVANGIYFAVIESDQNERAVCKIAVLR